MSIVLSIMLWVLLAVLVVGVAWFLGRAVARRQNPTAPPRATIIPPDQLPRPAARSPRPAPVAPPPALPVTPNPVVQDPAVQAVINWLISQAFEQTGMNVSQDKIAYQRIVDMAVQTTTALRTQERVSISLPALVSDATGPKHLETSLSQQGLQALVDD